MLVLTRKVGERIRIGDDITITVVRIQNEKVRIGIEAPRGLAVHRKEVFDRIKAQQASLPVAYDAFDRPDVIDINEFDGDD